MVYQRTVRRNVGPWASKRQWHSTETCRQGGWRADVLTAGALGQAPVTSRQVSLSAAAAAAAAAS